ncbi:MAG TPA: hypothetical protein VNK48_14620 [Xanthobacteraceae bacterium]|nr:hypothetical protein [Xanthobacteraceae bacterium]
MPTYVWRKGCWRDKKTGRPIRDKYPDAICQPYVLSDIPEYRSPIDGRLIASRSHRREDLRRNGCIEVDPPKRPRGFKNPRFAKKFGLPLNPELTGRDEPNTHVKERR